MNHPQTNYNPPFNITRASHLVFTARDLEGEPHVLHRGRRARGQRRERRHALAAWRRGALPPQPHAEEDQGRAGLRARRLSRVHRRRSRQGQGAFRPRRHGSALCRGAVPGPHPACLRPQRHAARTGRDPADPCPHADQDSYAQGRGRAAHGSLSGAGARRRGGGEVLSRSRLPRVGLHGVRRGQGRRDLHVSQGQPARHGVAAALGPALPPLSVTSCRKCITSCARSTSPAISASATASSTGRAGMAAGTLTMSICAIRTATASNCCCRRRRSSTSTTSRCATT